MSIRRPLLHELLIRLSQVKVYYQPPPSDKMEYPCIKYKKSGETPTYADDIRYFSKTRYILTVMDYDPDSKVLSKLEGLKYLTPDRNYTNDGLHHFVYTLFF